MVEEIISTVPLIFRYLLIAAGLTVFPIGIYLDLKKRFISDREFKVMFFGVGGVWALSYAMIGNPSILWAIGGFLVGGVLFGFGFLAGLLLGVFVGEGDVWFTGICAMLLPNPKIWLSSHTPVFSSFLTSPDYFPFLGFAFDFLLNVILFAAVIGILYWITRKLTKRRLGARETAFGEVGPPFIPVIVAVFFLTIWFGAIWHEFLIWLLSF